MGKFTLGAGLLMQGGPSVLKGAQTLDKLASNSTKFTLGIAGAGSVGSQLITNGTVDPKTLAVDLTTAYVLKGKGLAINVAGNATSGALNSYLTDQPVLNGAIGSGVGGIVSYGIGKGVESLLNKKFNSELLWQKYRPQPLGDEFPFIYNYRRNIIPEVSGNAAGEYFNRYFQIKYESLQKRGGNE